MSQLNKVCLKSQNKQLLQESNFNYRNFMIHNKWEMENDYY